MNHSPLFVAARYSAKLFDMTFNTQLKPLEFYKIFNTNLAYHEIEMFLNNMAVPMKPIPVLDDVTMAESKGFDKYSFRKDKTRRRK